ncbi:hypothetical protein D3C87_81700 [compost metagenome]
MNYFEYLINIAIMFVLMMPLSYFLFYRQTKTKFTFKSYFFRFSVILIVTCVLMRFEII